MKFCVDANSIHYRISKAARHSAAMLLALAVTLMGCDGNSSSSMTRDAQEPPTLTGTITIPSGNRVDQDTAFDLSEGRPLVQNPQQPALPGEVLLAGFVSYSSGAYGNGFNYFADQKDVFTLPMLEGQGVSLRFFNALDDASPINVHTRLINSDGVVVASEQDVTDMNRLLMAESDGLHTLEIETLEGPPLRYLLSSAPAMSVNAKATGSEDFVLGEAIVTLQQSVAGRSANVLPSQAPSGERHLGGSSHRWQVPLQGHGIREERIGVPASKATVPERQATLDWIRSLQQDPAVLSASPNYVVRSLSGPTNQNLYDELQQWHYSLIGLDADEANQGPWQAGISGADTDGEDTIVEGIRVAVLDTGVFSADGGMNWHPELNDNMTCAMPFNEGCFNAIDPGRAPLDSGSFHGTHVAGTVAASALTGGDITGVAFEATLVPVKVLENLAGSIADVIEGVNWVLNDGLPRADIINLSLGTAGDVPALKEALTKARAAGILLVAAAGNEANRQVLFPAAYDSVLSVGAVDCNGNRSEFSNFGFLIDLVAPGGGGGQNCADNQRFVWSAGADEGGAAIAGLAGTSMASPHVAGALALLLGEQSSLVNRERLPEIVEALVREQRLQSAQDPFFSESFGRGLLDARRLIGLGNSIDDLTVLIPDQRQLVFAAGVDSLSLNLTQGGNSQGLVTSVEVNPAPADDDWFTVYPQGDNSFRVQLLGEPPASGSRRGNLKVSYTSNHSTNTFSLPVIVLESSDESQRNAGTHFVQLIPVDSTGRVTEDAFFETEAELVDGVYHFHFDPLEIPAGDYLLLASSDIDNNGVLCEEGEACALFPSVSAPEPITITPDTRKELTMTTGYLQCEAGGACISSAVRK